ncbi:glycosyltransferase [Fusobacterium mortiferum]|uniref:glycosyltransferase n=1 Tax=Fusobacterium mortiferum TaxID=850 RepID=UPI003569488A
MNGIYLNFVMENELGVKKKIDSQMKALKKLNNNIEKIEIKGKGVYFKKIKLLNFSQKNNLIGKILRKIQTYILLIFLMRKKYYKEIQYIYIRYFFSSIFSINYFKFLKKIGVKIILELPTYPYDEEIKKENIFTKWDKRYRLKMHKYVDKIVTYSEDKVIWDIPCINISNGIDLEEVKVIEKKKHLGINFISVSNCSFWHGIDRFLYSLLQYKKNGGIEDLRFYIVGEGEETSKLKKIVDDNMELQDIVIFHGFKSGEELDEIYNNSDIALGSLGIHRLKLESVQPLKNREYCAKGLPFIIGFNDPNFKNKEYVYEVSYDDELIDIEKLIKWYRNLKISPEEIRKDAEEFTWDIQMKKVLDNI